MFALQSLQVLFSGQPEAAAVFKRHCLSAYSIEQALVSMLSNSSPVFQVRVRVAQLWCRAAGFCGCTLLAT